ncbi:hypothetical protein F5Y08DRAFT_81570 [Xylaria arbuscula]|nr:hypothetical protein F5Y08DRAFT_81570 [Xylaria arbuscula]
MIWECYENLHHGPYASESLSDGVNLQLKLSSRPLSLIQNQSPSHKGILVYWRDIYGGMSGKSLTEQSDMALIMAELAEDFSRIHHMSPYPAGHWKSTLPYDLLWHIRKLSDHQSRQPGPSWSRLPCGRQVMIPQPPYEGTTILADLLGHVMKPRTRNPFGQFESGKLIIKGVLRPLCVHQSHSNQYTIYIPRDTENSFCTWESGSAEIFEEISFT